MQAIAAKHRFHRINLSIYFGIGIRSADPHAACSSSSSSSSSSSKPLT
jgi:hypothetical protein